MFEENVKERIKEISALLEQYDVIENTFGVIGAIAFLVIGAILTMVIGEFWAVLLIILAAIPIFLSAKNSSKKPNEKELAEAVCCNMHFCVEVAKLKGKTIGIMEQTRLQVAHINYTEGNLPLYEEFIKYYPHMASYKLKKLASVKIGLY